MASDRSFFMRLTPKPPSYSRDAGDVFTSPGIGLLISLGQQRPVEELIMSARTLGSRPHRMPRFMASAVAMLLIARMLVLASLPDAPAPCSPRCHAFLPMRSNVDLTRSTSWLLRGDTPNIKERVPVRAPPTPADTGASTKCPKPDECTICATSLDDAGSIVEQSMNRRSRSTNGNTPG